MAEETKIGIKLEEKTKPIKKMCEKLMDAVNYELDKGIENIDTKELGEAIDMIKDLYEAKKEMYEACYYKSVIEAMEEHDFEDEDEIMEDGRRGYRGQPRDSRGRYMSRRKGYMPDMMMYDNEDWEDMQKNRDMDKHMGKMYYTEPMTMRNDNQTHSESRYDRARRGYEETKSMHKDNSSESKQMKMKSLEDYMKSLAEDVTEMVNDMSQEEKTLMKQKMSVLMQKI